MFTRNLNTIVRCRYTWTGISKSGFAQNTKRYIPARSLLNIENTATIFIRATRKKLYDSAEYVILKNLPLFKTRPNVEIAHALNGANAFLSYLAGRVNKTPRKLTQEDVFQATEVNKAPQEP